MGQMMDDGTMMSWPWPPILGLVVMVGTIALIVVVTWALVDRSRRPRDAEAGIQGTPVGDPALATLRDRFAGGEIDRDEFDERRRALER